MNLESIHVVVDKDVSQKVNTASDLLKKINRPIKKRLDIEALKKEKIIPVSIDTASIN